ncbi:hypothetical protein Tcan_02267 [Toxocara canis]|uniref:Uncharacterized protein n=1 Tax=Toxocara canis TaxID=6265 RepID=A0A0B2UK40_TOXCA|nr:hypothetical protein Tcan_02267 [Toxocara canis]
MCVFREPWRKGENANLKQQLRYRDKERANAFEQSRLREVDYAQRLRNREEALDRVRRILGPSKSKGNMAVTACGSRFPAQKVFLFAFAYCQ